MFVELKELLPQLGDTLVMTISSGSADMTVTVMAKTNLQSSPQVTAEPLVLIGTPDELDQEFTRILREFTPTHQTLMEALREAKTRIEQKTKASNTKAGSSKANAKGGSSQPLSQSEPSNTATVTVSTANQVSQPGLF